MKTRVIAALVGLAIIAPVLLLGGQTGLRVVVLLVALVCCNEYASMVFPRRTLLYTVGLGLWVVGLAFGSWWLPTSWAVAGLAVGWIASVSSWVFWRPSSLADGVRDVGFFFLGVSWVGLLLFLPAIRALDQGLEWVGMVLAISWASDSGAYLAGRTWGRRPLHPSVSPKKTWEGFFGGVLMAGIIAAWFGSSMWPDLSVAPLFLMGMVFASAGVVGDLWESFIKRSFGVKDSGWIMPGHGGFLDRIDSVLFVAPLVYGYALWQGG